MDVFSNIPTFSNILLCHISNPQVISCISSAPLPLCGQFQPRCPRVCLWRGHAAETRICDPGFPHFWFSHFWKRVAKHETWVWAQNRLSTWRVIYLCKHGFVSWNICLHFFSWLTWSGGRICAHILFCLNARTLTDWRRLTTCRLFCGKRQSSTLWLSSLGSFVGNVNILI